MSVNFKQIGQRVKEIRYAKGMSQAELAEQIDMSVPHISLIETATKKASLSTLILIANALGVTVDALLNGNRTIPLVHRHPANGLFNPLVQPKLACIFRCFLSITSAF